MREFELLQHIFGRNVRLPGHVTIPPGDDMGAVRIGDATLLVTVDQVIDGVHVRSDNTGIDLMARKAIVRNLSDVAAMAARPIGAVAAACIPRSWSAEQAQQLADALHDVAARYDCPLIGGDVSTADQPLTLSVTVFACVAGNDPILRSGANVGDRIYVTGALGGAWDEQGGGPHLSAEPRVREAMELARTLGPDLHSMIDLSDGLAGDLGHICRMSGVAAEIDAHSVPLRDGATLDNALADGEDYELCFTVDPGKDVPTQLGDVLVTCIGRIMDPRKAQSMLMLVDGDMRRAIEPRSWEHGPSR